MDANLTLFLCGDIMIARGIDQILPEPCAPDLHEPHMDDARDYIALAEQVSGPIPRGVPPAYPWGDALAVLEAMRPDASIVNLETSITRRGEPDPHKWIHYRVSPQNAACLAAASIDACMMPVHPITSIATGIWNAMAMPSVIISTKSMYCARSISGLTIEDTAR